MSSEEGEKITIEATERGKLFHNQMERTRKWTAGQKEKKGPQRRKPTYKKQSCNGGKGEATRIEKKQGRGIHRRSLKKYQLLKGSVGKKS